MRADKESQCPDSVNTLCFDSKWQAGIAIFLLVLLAVVFYLEPLRGNRSLVFDAADYFYPIFYTVSESLRHGQLPLWDPYLLNGFPILANIQAQIFYPVNLLFLAFSSFTPYVVHLSIILHYLGAGIAMFFLARRFTGDPYAALLSALAYMFSGFMVGHFQHVTMIEVVVWLPLVFLLLDKALEERRFDWAVAAGGALGLSTLAGHPQTSHAMIFILAVHAFYRGFCGTGDSTRRRSVFLAVAMLSVCLLVGGLLAAVQLLPAWELAGESTRGTPLTFEYAARSGQFSLRDSISLFIPNYYGALSQPYWGSLDSSQSLLYGGIVPLLLAMLAVVAGRRTPQVLYCGGMALFSLLLALGENGPLFRLFFAVVPGFNYFRSPAHTVFIYCFFSALLAGYGLKFLRRGVGKIAVYWVVAMVIGCGGLLYLFGPEPPLSIAAEAQRNMHTGFFVFVGFAFVAAAIIFLGVHSRKLFSIASAALILLTAVEIYYLYSKSSTNGLGVGPAYYETTPNVVSKVRKDAGIPSDFRPGTNLNAAELQRGLFRIYTRPEGVPGTQPFGFNRAMLHRTFLVEGYEPLELGRHRKLVATLSGSNLENLLKITNSRYVSSADTGAIEAYPDALPRTFIVPNARYLADDDQVLGALATFDPRTEVILSGQGTNVAGRSALPAASVASVVEYTSDRVTIATRSQQDGYLVLSDTYYPGWTAHIDGAKSEVMRANFDFRAVYLSKGDHTVEFKYVPRFLRVGAVISLATLLAAGSFLVLRRLKSAK